MQSAKQEQMNIPLSLWERIEVVVGENGEQGIYVSRIEDIAHDSVLISKPDFIGGNKLLTANAQVYVHFMRPDALYRFSARLRPTPGQNEGMIQLCDIGGYERVQRRQFVRLSLRLELKYALLKNLSPESGLGSLAWQNSYSANVSAGGLLMKVDNAIKKSDHLLIKITKYEEMGIPRLVTAICCRIIRLEDGHFAGVEFITDSKLRSHFSTTEISLLPAQIKGFTLNVQNKIVKYIFEQQIKERQKGLL